MGSVESWNLTIDGHHWVVREQPDRPGGYDFEWLTGSKRYGFSMGGSDKSPMDRAAIRFYIADFLAQINPETGYLD